MRLGWPRTQVARLIKVIMFFRHTTRYPVVCEYEYEVIVCVVKPSIPGIAIAHCLDGFLVAATKGICW